MTNITNENDSRFKATEAPKSKFQQIVDKTSPRERIEMVQLGFNPFNAEDIEKFQLIVKAENKLSFFARLRAAWSFLMSSKVSSDLQIFVLRDANKKSEEPIQNFGNKIADRDKIFTPDVANMTKEQITNAMLTESMVTAGPKAGYHPDPKYQEEILNIVKQREEAEKKAKEEIVLNQMPEGFIPGPIPTIIEEKKSKATAMKSKRVKVSFETVNKGKYTVLKGVHRGSGVKVKEEPIDIRVKDQKLKGSDTKKKRAPKKRTQPVKATPNKKKRA